MDETNDYGLPNFPNLNTIDDLITVKKKKYQFAKAEVVVNRNLDFVSSYRSKDIQYKYNELFIDIDEQIS